jgi:hypothetical protein
MCWIIIGGNPLSLSLTGRQSTCQSTKPINVSSNVSAGKDPRSSVAAEVSQFAPIFRGQQGLMNLVQDWHREGRKNKKFT